MRTFIFDFDDTLAGFSVWNTWAIYLDNPVMRPIGGLLPGAYEVLEDLSSRGDRLYMLTLNLLLNEEQKWRKLRRVGLERFFHERNTFMVGKKTPEMYRRICRGKDLKRCYMVGNSYTNDIAPALQAGINAIYIRRPLFKKAFPDLHPSHPNLIRLSSIRRILERYDEL